MIKRTCMALLRKIFGTGIAIAIALTVSGPIPRPLDKQERLPLQRRLKVAGVRATEVVDKLADAAVHARRCTPLHPGRRT